MYSNEEKIWFNQSLLYHRDSTFNTNSSVDVSIFLSTSDYRSYSPLMLKISITDVTTRQSRFCSLSFSNAMELIACLKNATEDLPKKIDSMDKVSVQKKMYDKVLGFEFGKVSGQIVSTITISQNGDIGTIIVPYSIFNAFGILTRSYVNDFIKLNIDFVNRSVLIDILDQSKITKDLLKTLPSSIERQVNIPAVKEFVPEELVETVEQIEDEINDFDKFLNDNIDNVVIPEIERLEKEITNGDKEVKVVTESINSFMEDVLTLDLSKFENLITSASTTANPIKTLTDAFMSKMKVEDNFSFFPGLSDEDHKSIIYMSKSVFTYFFQRYVRGNISIPSSVPVIKYKIDKDVKVSETNISLAYDLLLISSYIRCFRNKISSREFDSSKNKSVFYLGIRSFVDPLVFGIMERNDIEISKRCIIDRFKTYCEKGFFKNYDSLLDSYNLQPISENEFNLVINEMAEKVIGKTAFINELHKKYNGNNFLKLPYNNKLSLEQIIEEAIPLQINIYNKVNDVNDIDEVNNMIVKSGFSTEVISEFVPKSEVKREKIPNLVRSVTFYNKDIPERFKENFIEYLSTLKDNFDFNSSDFPVEEIGENILKVLYVWNESGKNDTYTDFMLKIEECPMDKTLILAKYKAKEEVKSEEWGDMSWD